MKISKIFGLIVLAVSISTGYASAKDMGGMMHGEMMGGGMMMGEGMAGHKEEHHKMMNDMMQSIADLAAVVKGSVTDKTAKDKCDAIIAKAGEMIKKHDEMWKEHQQKMEGMMKSHKDMMEKKKEKKPILVLRERMGGPSESLKTYVKDLNKVRKDIVTALKKGPRTVPDLAKETGLATKDALWHLMAMKRYGELVETGQSGDYFAYALKEQER